MSGLDFLFDDKNAEPRTPTHPAAIDPDKLLDDCTMTRGRTGGPGGQHRNKIETHVRYIHKPTGISAQAGEQRSPEANRKRALKRLRLALATEHREGVPAGEARTALWMSRCTKGRIACNPSHADFPAMLSEAMDVLFAGGLDAKTAATRLQCSPSQLLKLIAKHPAALEVVNRQRKQRGMHALRA